MPLWVTRLLRILGLLALLVAYGTLAFHLTEGVSLYDSLYWTVTVLSTVGFGDITPITAVGKAVFMSLAVGGITLFGYAVTQLGSLFLETELDKVLRRTLLGGSERKMRDHVVILGWNAETSVAYEELRVNKIPTVVVVEEEQTARRLSRRNISAVVGDPRRERTLQEARLNDARGLLVALEDDTRSLMAVLAARKVSKTVPIIVRIHNSELAGLFYQAGATRVIDTGRISGLVLASAVFEPLVAHILEDLAGAAEGLDLVEFSVPEAADGKTLAELRIKEDTNAYVLCVRRGTELHPNPPLSFQLRKGDVVVLLGTAEEITKARQRLMGTV